ncbi:hypothetical protein BGP_0593 [Beggiatoa sp. PS]|nr:hypothetical protein BGP_0593 [Beggiatoa sp. PS]
MLIQFVVCFSNSLYSFLEILIQTKGTKDAPMLALHHFFEQICIYQRPSISLPRLYSVLIIGSNHDHIFRIFYDVSF